MSQEQIKQFIDEAQVSLSGGQFQQALDLVDQAIAIEENTTEAHVLRGIALSQLSRPDEATSAFRNAIMYGPYNPKAYFNLAVHYFQLGEKLKAEEMAKETMRIEPGHPGARQLLTSIENERAQQAGAAQQKMSSFPGDPLAQDPAAAAPATSSESGPLPPGVGAAPAAQPSAPQANSPYGGQPSKADRFAPVDNPSPGQAPTPTGYYRPGYDTSTTHSIAFVGNMEKAWDVIGIVLSAASILIFIVGFVIGFGAAMEAFSNQGRGSNSMANMMAMQPGGILLSVLGWGIRLFSMAWMIMDLIDRRANWLWFLPWFLCCCCGVPGIPQLIYIWKGRP